MGSACAAGLAAGSEHHPAARAALLQCLCVLPLGCGLEGQRAPCKEQSNGTSTAGLGLTDLWLLAIEKHLTSTPQTSAIQNRMLFPSTDGNLPDIFPFLCNSLTPTCAHVLV